MVDFITIKTVKSKLDEKEQEVEVLLKDIWAHFKDALGGRHEGERIHNSIHDQINAINFHIESAKASMNIGKHDSALAWLESARKNNKVIKEYEDVLVKLERKELKNLLKAEKESEKMDRKIVELEKNVKEMKHAQAA